MKFNIHSIKMVFKHLHIISNKFILLQEASNVPSDGISQSISGDSKKGMQDQKNLDKHSHHILILF